MLRLRSLGKTLIEAGDVRLTPAAETVFAVALYLIVEAGRRIGRDELTRMLWPGVSEARAQHGLRQALYRLKVLGATIKADRTSLILSPRFCTTDFSSLVTPQSTATLEQLAETIEGSFLPGYHPELSDEFTAWVDRQRDVVHSAVARALMAGMQAKKRVSDWSGAERLASMCLSIDPLNEEATLTVAEAAALGGSKARALSILNTYIKDIGTDAGEIKLPAELLRRRISEAYRDSSHTVKEAPFVGREEEMAELTRALTDVQSRRGLTYLLVGEPGIGKSRLMSEFTRTALLQPIRIVRVGCQPQDMRQPASAFVDLVPQLLSLPGALGCAPETMQYLRRLTAHDPEEARNRAQHEESDLSYVSARTALMDLIDAVSSEVCIVIELEDAQWLDSQSKRLVEELSDWNSTHRVLFLISSRTNALVGERIRTLPLRPLPVHAGRMVASALATTVKRAGNDFLDWCVSCSGGNPYYLIELLRNGTEHRSGYQAPESLTRLLQNRLSVLSDDARSLLQACCILGKHSSAERIESCIDMTRMTLLRALSELEMSGMIEVDGSKMRSRHDLLTAVVYSEMRTATRMMLHRFAAERLEFEADASHSVSLLWESAEHWVNASDANRAVLLLRRFGNYLMDIGLPDESARVLERASSLVTAPVEQYQIGTELTLAFMRGERSAEALTEIDRLLKLRKQIYPEPSPLDTLSVLALHARWENGEAIPAIVADALAALSSESASVSERVSAAGWLITAADNLCDFPLGHRVYRQVVEQLESPEVTAESRLWLRMVYNASFGDRALAQENASALIHHARKYCQPMVAIRYLRHGAHVLRCYGSLESALSVALEAFEWSKKLNVKKPMAMCAGLISSLHLHVGDDHCAKRWTDRAFSAHNPGDTVVLDMNMWSYRAECAIRLGNVADAELSLSNGWHGAEGAQSARSLIRYHALQTQFLLLTNQLPSQSFLESFKSVYDIAKRSTLQDYNAESLLLGLEASGRTRDAARIASDFVSQFRRDQCLLATPLVTVISRLHANLERCD